MNKIKIAILIGGKTGEHKVNLISSKYILPLINRNKYDVLLIGIDRKGTWHLLNERNYLSNSDNPARIELKTTNLVIYPVNKENKVFFIQADTDNILGYAQIFFSLIGGTYAEDGRLQGMLDMLDVAYIGAGVTGSVLGIDKVIMKQVLQHSGIRTAKFFAMTRCEQTEEYVSSIENGLGFPLFIKPANLGSSIGITKAYNHEDFVLGLKKAFKYDNKIIIEEYIKAREIECAVLGNKDLFVSVPGEIIPHYDFYNYEAKYIDKNGADLIIPATLTKNQTKEVQELSRKVFKILNCACFGRIDFFLTHDGIFYTNEINTIPGFTNISMYPKLMQASGISYSDLIDKLVLLAFENKSNRDRLKTDTD